LVRFGVFEVNLQSGELGKQGLKIRLQEQPFQILAMLLERPGEVITRVDFNQSLGTAIKKLRQALENATLYRDALSPGVPLHCTC